eukprot:g8504.t1
MATASVEAARVGDTLNQAWKNDKSKFGLKMLQKMGWTEGKGLGKHEDGVSEHVKVAKKSNNLGLGATHDASGAAGWASAAMSFNGVLEALGKAYGGDGAAATNGKKKGDKKTKKKARKAEKRRTEKDSDGAADSSGSGGGGGGGGEGGLGTSASAQARSSCPSRAKRVKSKDVKGFSAADLRAILGQAATTVNPSLPSYPVIGGGGNGGGAAAAAEPKARKKSSKKSKTPPPANAPHRPRTRSMDETATAEESSKPRKRPRHQSTYDLEGDTKEAGVSGGEGESDRASSISKRKASGGGGGGGEEPVAAPKRSKDKKRRKRSKNGEDR